jgi:hypothetical protein
MGIIIYFHNVVTHFGARYKQKIQNNIYIYIYISVRRVYYNAQKIVKKWLRRIIYEIKKFNSVFFLLIKVLLAKKIQFEKKNSKLNF